jgi:hypothetical protein
MSLAAWSDTRENVIPGSASCTLARTTTIVCAPFGRRLSADESHHIEYGTEAAPLGVCFARPVGAPHVPSGACSGEGVTRARHGGVRWRKARDCVDAKCATSTN